jgi:hypothetical protein
MFVFCTPICWLRIVRNQEWLCRIARDGLSYEGAPVEIPDEHGAGERLLQERNWVRVMQQTMPQGVPRRDDAVAVIEQALCQVGFPIQ